MSFIEETGNSLLTCGPLQLIDILSGIMNINNNDCTSSGYSVQDAIPQTGFARRVVVFAVNVTNIRGIVARWFESACLWHQHLGWELNIAKRINLFYVSHVRILLRRRSRLGLGRGCLHLLNPPCTKTHTPSSRKSTSPTVSTSTDLSLTFIFMSQSIHFSRCHGTWCFLQRAHYWHLSCLDGGMLVAGGKC